jgi:hypothetical protein
VRLTFQRVALLAVGMISARAFADPEPLYDVPDAPPWREAEVAFPAYPDSKNFLAFSVGSLSKNRFKIDTTSVAIGADEVVRYVLAVEAPGGASNITWEGIRCSTRQYKVYAIGLADRTWSAQRDSRWLPIESLNRHHAVLNREVFCPSGTPVRSANEALAALRQTNEH